VLLDLYDTLAQGLWPEVEHRLSTRLGVGDDVLLRAFELTRLDRGTGRFAGPEDDMAALVRACGLESDPLFVRELTRAHIEFLVSGGVRLFDDALSTLRALRDAGIRTAIVSNCDHWTRPIVDGLGLQREVDGLILSFEVGALKPDPAIFRLALDGLKVRPDRAAFVDDQIDYCAGASALGLRTFLIDRRGADRAGSAPAGSDGHALIRDLTALLS
jgi:FMN phosphatase YigB (HAD superfamily)